MKIFLRAFVIGAVLGAASAFAMPATTATLASLEGDAR